VTSAVLATRRVGRAIPRPLLRPSVVLSVVILSVVLAWTIAPGVFSSRDPLVGVGLDKFRAPSWSHPFGTDQLGRDMFARVVHGAGLSVRGAVLATMISFVGGTVIGALAGYAGRWADEVVMRLVDVLLSIPGLLLSLMIVTVLGFGTTKVAIAVGIAGIAQFARIARGEVLRVNSADFVEASRACGSRWYSVLFGHVLPNAVAPLIALATLEFGTAILAIASMSFLGYGAPPPTPEWGTLIASGRDFVATSWWIATMPGLVVAAVALSFNRLSRAIDSQRWTIR